jgi:hypothetical protein
MASFGPAAIEWVTLLVRLLIATQVCCYFNWGEVEPGQKNRVVCVSVTGKKVLEFSNIQVSITGLCC